MIFEKADLNFAAFPPLTGLSAIFLADLPAPMAGLSGLGISRQLINPRNDIGIFDRHAAAIARIAI
jgi:hypothetical protein